MLNNTAEEGTLYRYLNLASIGFNTSITKFCASMFRVCEGLEFLATLIIIVIIFVCIWMCYKWCKKSRGKKPTTKVYGYELGEIPSSNGNDTTYATTGCCQASLPNVFKRQRSTTIT